MPVFLGMDAELSYESGGFSADAAAGNKADISGGVGTVLDLIKDVTLNLETAEADVTTRGNNGWRAKVGTLKDGSVEAQIQWDTSNAAFNVLMTAWLNSAAVGIACLDEGYVAEATPGANDGNGTGLVSNFAVLNFTREEGLEDAIVANITLSPTYSDVNAGWLDRGGWL